MIQNQNIIYLKKIIYLLLITILEIIHKYTITCAKKITYKNLGWVFANQYAS